MTKKPDQGVRWSKKEGALLYHYEREKPTSMFIAHYFESVTYGDSFGGGYRPAEYATDARYSRNFAQELDARGYDLTTFRFSIQRKP